MGMVQSRIGYRFAVFVDFVIPGGHVIGPLIFLISGKQALMKGKVFINHEGGIGIIDYVIFDDTGRWPGHN